MNGKLLAPCSLLLLQTIAGAAYGADNGSSAPASKHQPAQLSDNGNSWTDAEGTSPSQAPAVVLVPAPKNSGPPGPAPPKTTKSQTPGASQATLALPEQPAPPSAHKARPQPAAQVAESADGQWVYSDQYGWIWMPYAQAYTYVTPAGSPYEYVYYPTFGWRWVYAPWVLGWGPAPYWGVYAVSYTHLRAHETVLDLVCRLLLEKKKTKN